MASFDKLVFFPESYPMSMAASIEILAPVIDLSDNDEGDDDDEDASHKSQPSRCFKTRRSGL